MDNKSKVHCFLYQKNAFCGLHACAVAFTVAVITTANDYSILFKHTSLILSPVNYKLQRSYLKSN